MDADREEPSELLERRLMLVASLSSVNAEALKANQKIGALHMEIQRVTIFETNEDEGTAGEVFEDAQAKLAKAEAELANCEERIEALEDEVADIDRRLDAAE
ncbi:hypothetical protein [Amorphus sp. 3PC139-8]|uniref:hypothetical protein n=1 Tax=Amorphus sp. 3PC139-8 TaxID=2735676 RepID=UPI00345DBEF7